MAENWTDFDILYDATNISTNLSHDFRVSFLRNDTCVVR